MLLAVSGLLFGTVAIVVSVAIIMSVAVTNVYYRKDTKLRPPRCCRTRRFANEHVAVTVNSEGKFLVKYRERSQDTEHSKKLSTVSDVADALRREMVVKEWKEFAIIMDRCFFWILFIAGAIGIIYIFSHVPSTEKDMFGENE